MRDLRKHTVKLPPEQQAIRDRCFHPSGTFVEFPEEDVETSIAERFERIVELHPNRLAFKHGSEVGTYAQINRLANRCGRALVEKLGFDAEPVGLFLSNGLNLFGAMLGILKAGKFVVNVDPTLPPERTESTFADSQVRLIITDGAKWTSRE